MQGRSLSFAEFKRLLEAFGFVLGRTEGSQAVYYHVSSREKQVIQPLGHMAKDHQVRQFLGKVKKHVRVWKIENDAPLSHQCLLE